MIKTVKGAKIRAEIMKTIGERELQKINKRKTNKGRKEQGEEKL